MRNFRMLWHPQEYRWCQTWLIYWSAPFAQAGSHGRCSERPWLWPPLGWKPDLHRKREGRLPYAGQGVINISSLLSGVAKSSTPFPSSTRLNSEKMNNFVQRRKQGVFCQALASVAPSSRSLTTRCVGAASFRPAIRPLIVRPIKQRSRSKAERLFFGSRGEGT